jgi:hypothetical protein
MDITLAVIRGGGAAYSVHLLVQGMRDPQRVCAWLPRLLAGWHKGTTEMEEARQGHEEQARQRKQERAALASNRLVTAAKPLSKLVRRV